MLKFNNEFHTMEELEELYPDKWVLIENPKLNSGLFIVEGELIAVGDSREIGDFAVECRKAGRNVDYERTTDAGSVGVLEVEGLTIRVE